MRASRLASIASTLVVMDTETWAIDYLNPDPLAPPLVLGSFAWLTPTGLQGEVVLKADVLAHFAELADGETIFGVANGPFDFLVLISEYEKLGIDIWSDVFDIYEQDRVFDILDAECLHAIAQGHRMLDPKTMTKIVNPETGKQGGYSLASVTYLVTGRKDAKKNDIYRKRYKEFDGLKLEEMPPEAVQYPLDDALNTGEDVLGQTGLMPRVMKDHNFSREGVCKNCGSKSYTSTCRALKRNRNLHDLAHKARANFSLSLGSVDGFHVNQAKVDIIEWHARRDQEKNFKPFRDIGLITEEGTENRAELKRRIAIAYGAKDTCRVCRGKGKIAPPMPRQRVCTECKGYSTVEKKDGPAKRGWQLANPDGCNVCKDTGKINDPKHLIGCYGLGDTVTCDGTGLQLTSNCPRSEGGGIAYGRDALGETGDDTLSAYAEAQEGAKKLSSYIPYLRTARTPVAGHALECPYVIALNAGAKKKPTCTCPGPFRDIGIRPRYRVPLETGRVSAEGLVQTFPREPGYLDTESLIYVPSLRECIEPYEHIIEVDDDYVLGEGEEWYVEA